MTLKIQLVKDDEIVYEVPLDLEHWTMDNLQRELHELEDRFSDIAAVHGVLSNITRARMLSQIVRGSQRRFSQLMDMLAANQKIVMENLQRMMDVDLVERIESGRRNIHYAPSSKGVAGLMSCLVMARVMDEVEKIRR
ncbi:MAG: hypothetical protein ACE5PO_01615 [Candidatus Bathyarchaeia archaeon]